MKKQILLALMLMFTTVSFVSKAAPIPSELLNGSFDFGGLIDPSSVNRPLITDKEVWYQGNRAIVGNTQGDLSGIFGNHDMLIANNSIIELQVGNYNDTDFLNFSFFDFFPLNTGNIDLSVTLLSIDEISQPTNSGIGLIGSVMLISSGYADTFGRLTFEISENGTHSGSGNISTIQNIAAVPAPAAFWCMIMGLPGIIGMSRKKNATQKQAIA